MLEIIEEVSPIVIEEDVNVIEIVEENQRVIEIETAIQGIQGKSAYRAWLDLGNEGTIQDYLNTNIGKDGADGLTTSVNGIEHVNGEITLDTDDIPDTSTNRYTNDIDINRLKDTSGINTGDQDLSGKLDNSHNTSETAHNDIRESIIDVDAIARGKARARVFDTVSDLDIWLSDNNNILTLLIGDNFYIKDTEVPDYWWDGTQKQKLETEKVDLTDYYNKLETDNKFVVKEINKGLISDEEKNNLVPYTGANKNVDLGNNNISALQLELIKYLSLKNNNDTFDCVQHFVAPSTYTNDTLIVNRDAGTTADVLNVVGDFLYIGKLTPFEGIFFDFGTILSIGTNRKYEYLATGDIWTEFIPTADGTNQWQQDGIVLFDEPTDWIQGTVNLVSDLYWIRVGTQSGTFSTEPTLRMCLPAVEIPANVLEIFAMKDDIVPSFAIDKNGGVALGYSDALTYKLRVAGTFYASTGITTGTISGSTGTFSGAITQTLTTTGQTHVGGAILNGPVATALIPSQNSPVMRFSAQAWNGFVTKINAMDIYVNPDSEPITRSRMCFKNTTINGNADASELMNLTSDGRLNVIGLAQPRDEVFDYVAQYVTAVYTDITNLVSNFGNITGDVLNATGDILYFGKRDKFSAIQIVIGTAKSTGGTFVWEYSTTGNTWTTLTVTDGTVNGTLGPLSQNGNVSFSIPSDWTTNSNINSVGPLYFVRLRVTGSAFTTEPTLQLALPDNSVLLTDEIFSDTTFDLGTSKWGVTGGWAYSTGDYTFTWGGSGTTVGTLYQLASNFKNPAKPNTWYRFRYQVGVAGPTGTSAWIGPEFAQDNTYFQVSSTTEVDVFFKSNSNPQDFVIYTSANAISGLQLYGVSLTELNNGDIIATGIVTANGYKNADGSVGITTTQTFKDGDSATKTMTIVNGLIVGIV